MNLDMRKTIAEEIEPIVGGKEAAMAIVTTVEILYRKFIRLALHQEDKAKCDSLYYTLVEACEPLLATGPEVFMRSCRTQVQTIRRTVPPANKKGKPEIVTEKKTILLRPKVAEGPMRPDEAALVAKINKALATVETALPKKVDLSIFPNPVNWAKEVHSGVERLYTQVEPLGKLLARRKHKVRLLIDEKRAGAPGAARDGSSQSKSNIATNVSQMEWTQASDEFVSKIGTDERDLFWEALYTCLGVPIEKATPEILLERSIKDLLEGILVRAPPSARIDEVD